MNIQIINTQIKNLYMNDAIYFLSKADQYYEFSNFHTAPIEIDGKIWYSTEAYFQAMKFPDNPNYQEIIRREKDTKIVKKLGSTINIKLRDDWENVKDQIMERAIDAKFTQHNNLKNLLLSTNNRLLIENNKNDNYWAIGNGNGLNKLGIMLCNLRERLKNEI